MVIKVLGDVMQLFNFQDSNNLNKTELIYEYITVDYDNIERICDIYVILRLHGS